MTNREKFENYCNGNLEYTKLTLVMMNWDIDCWEKLGKYVDEVLGENLDEYLRFEKDYAAELGKDYTRGFGIYFFTSSLNYDTLQLMFEDPILHNDYGEGFDEGDDEDGNPIDSEYSAISFFETIEGVEFHFSNDHRGREHCEMKDPSTFTTEDFTIISKTQNFLVSIALETSNRYLFCDTESVTTQGFHQMMLGELSDELALNITHEKYDFYFLLAPSIPFVQDGTRLFPNHGQDHFQLLMNLLSRYNKSFHVIYESDLNRRVNMIKNIIENS